MRCTSHSKLRYTSHSFSQCDVRRIGLWGVERTQSQSPPTTHAAFSHFLIACLCCLLASLFSYSLYALATLQHALELLLSSRVFRWFLGATFFVARLVEGVTTFLLRGGFHMLSVHARRFGRGRRIWPLDEVCHY